MPVLYSTGLSVLRLTQLISAQSSAPTVICRPSAASSATLTYQAATDGKSGASPSLTVEQMVVPPIGIRHERRISADQPMAASVTNALSCTKR